MKQVFLSKLIPSKSGRVQKLFLKPAKCIRLQELGMLPGNTVACVCAAPSGSPLVFWIKGAMIALRRDDCEKIVVEVDE